MKLICQVGFVANGQPFVIPTAWASGRVPLHSRFSCQSDAPHLKGRRGSLRDSDVARRFGTRPFCLSPLDELPFSDSVWSGNAGGRCQRKIGGTEAFTEHVMRDRWAEVRPPNRQELAGTLVLALPLTEASAKMPVPGG